MDNKCFGCLFFDICRRKNECDNYTPADPDEEIQSWRDGIQDMYDEWVEYATEYDD